MNRILYVPYKNRRYVPGQLRKRIGGVVVKARGYGTRIIPRKDDVIVNWGCSEFSPNFVAMLDFDKNIQIVNHPHFVSRAANKLKTFQFLETAQHIEWTEDASVAYDWSLHGHLVYCRTKLCAAGGRGIVVAKRPDEIVSAPLYTKGIPDNLEYRVYILNGKPFHIAQKKKRNGVNADPLVKNHANGYVYAFKSMYKHNRWNEMVQNAVNAVHDLGLHFAAVDILVDQRNYESYICEVNTAPQLRATSLKRFADVLSDYISRL